MKEFAEYIVSCNGVNVKKGSEGVKYLELEHKEVCNNKNVNINLNNFVTDIYKLENRYKDLLEIAGYIFAADRKTYRGKDDDLEYHSWSRAFDFHIKVRDYDFWIQQEIQKLLQQTLCFMSGDHSYKFTFYKAGEDFPTSIFDNEKFVINTSDNLRVALFSGGIDSLSGIIELLETSNDEICLVSHQSGLPGTQKTQRILYEEINKLYPGRCKHYKFHCGLSHTKSKDETQRTRSFLYTSIAFALAKTYKQDSIYVYENGITSINFAETQDLMNGRASRTTHPKTIGLLEKLFSKIAEESFNINNPYLFKTKSDVVEVLKKYGKLDLLDSSVSCSTTRNHPAGFTHCGICSQCIDRRFAVYATKVESYDANGIYHFDFLQEDLEEDEIKKSLAEYIRFAQKFKNQNIDSFYLERGSEIVDIEEFIDGKDETERVENIFNLCQRHAIQIEDSITRMMNIYDPPLAKKKPKSFFTLIIEPRIYQKTEKDCLDESKNELLEEKISNKEIEHKGLRSFKRGELKKELENYIAELNLEKHDTVPSKKIGWITRQLIKKGYDAKEASVAATLRRMDYSFSNDP
ncbi:MAG: 7-cyano-7-deazaguanine synthase [Melioribacteraceae bacterium]